MSLSEPLIPFHGVAGCCCWSQSQPCLRARAGNPWISRQLIAGPSLVSNVGFSVCLYLLLFQYKPNVINLHYFSIVIRWIQVIWTPQFKCYWFLFCTFTTKLMKLNVNDDFIGVMSQKGAGHFYIYKNLFLTFLLYYLFCTIIIVYC